MFSTTLAAGTLFHHVMAGGGGWGDPFTRDPHRVAADVRDGKVSADAAATAYGVVLGAGGEVDGDATRAARAEHA
jgi:N-methylhydantoinase B